MGVAREDDKQRVLDATDLVRLVGEHVALRPKGREYVGLCPFHDDHSPSMHVVPAKQIYYCFACGAGGNALAFVMNFHRMPFPEALRHLADRAGITLTPWRPQHREGAPAEDPSDLRAQLLAANLSACDFFRAVLTHPAHGEAARGVIARRGVSPEMVELFQLGAAPARWDGLVVTAASKRLPIEPFVRAGLFKPRDAGADHPAAAGHYDAFRNRLMFPIHDQIGRVIGFGGRRLNDEDEPKYINSAESALFDKSQALYALHQAAQDIRRTRTAIVTEGYMDAIACHQAGIRNVVATLGTALTAGNARLLRRLCDTVILLYDGDEAGHKAAERAVEVFFDAQVDLRIALLSSVTDAKDPDELLKRDGGAAVLRQAFAQAVDPLALLFQRVRREFEGRGIAGGTRVIEEFIARLVDLGLRPTDRDLRCQLVVKGLAAITGVGYDAISAIIARRVAARQGSQRARPDAPERPAIPRLTPADHLLGCALCDPALLASLADEDADLLTPGAFADPEVAAVASAAMETAFDDPARGIEGVLAALESAEAQRQAMRLHAGTRELVGDDPERLRLHWREQLDRLRRERDAARAAENAGDDPQTNDDAAAIVRAVRRRRAMGENPRVSPRWYT